NIMALTVGVCVLGLVFFSAARAALAAPGAINPYGVDLALLGQGTLDAALFAGFVVVELLLLLNVLELAKRRLPGVLMPAVYPAAFVGVLLLHGLLGSLLSGQSVRAELLDKLVVTSFFLPG